VATLLLVGFDLKTPLPTEALFWQNLTDFFQEIWAQGDGPEYHAALSLALDLAWTTAMALPRGQREPSCMHNPEWLAEVGRLHQAKWRLTKIHRYTERGPKKEKRKYAFGSAIRVQRSRPL